MKKCCIRVAAMVCIGLLVPLAVFAAGQTDADTAQPAQSQMSKEAPELAALVASGDLPPLEERIPEEPYIQQVYENIGRYGGTINRTWTGPDDKFGVGKMTHDWLVRLNETATDVEPNVVESWDISDDFTTYTFKLRKGMKWSDGTPFTVDDVLFYWNHVITNPEVYYANDVDWWYKSPVSGNPCTVDKVDDLHFSLTFDDAYPTFLFNMATNYGDFFGHQGYLKTILPEFAGEEAVQKMADDEGYASVKDFLKWKIKYPFIWPEIPTIRAWMPANSPREERYVQKRNPYYWKVDPEGNQLPYIDEVVYTYVQDKELVNLQALAGQVDFQSRHMKGENLSTFLENQEREDYRIVLNAVGFPGDATGIVCNLTTPDPVLREIFHKTDFRIGVSYAMDREEMIEILLNGMGEPTQAASGPVFPFYDEEWKTMYTEYSPERAAEHFEKAGLTWDSRSETWLRPDGNPLEIVFEVQDNNAKAAELVVNYLNEVGIKAVSKVDDRGLYDVRKNNYEFEMTFSGWPGNPFTAPQHFIPLDRYSALFGEYGVWVETNGEQGIEPTGDLGKLAPLWQTVNASRTEEEKFANLEKIYDLYHKNLWIIGLYSGGQPSYFVVNDKLRNVGEGLLNANYMRSPNNLEPWQLYYEE